MLKQAVMNLAIERKWILGGFSLALLLTGVSGYASVLNVMQLRDRTNTVQHIDRQLSRLTDTMNTTLQAESALRSYLLGGDQPELVRYHQTIATLDAQIHGLRFQVPDNSSQLKQLELLESLIAQWKSLIDQEIQIFQTEPIPTPIPAPLRRQVQKNRLEIQQLVTAMQSSTEQQLQQGVERTESNINLRLTIDLSTALLSFIVLSSMVVLDQRHMLKRQQAESQRKQAEERQHILIQEKELSETKLRFFTMVSHEFRTPLSLILGSAQLLLEDTQNWSIEKKHNNLERIQSAARMMNQLLTDTLTITRAEVGKLEFSPTLIDVESFCLNLLEDLQVLCTENQIIQFISSGHCPSVCLDEKLLYSILSNLLSNAIKYSPQGSNIQFRLDYLPEAVIFEIKDQGLGIPIEVQSNLYEPFHRGSNVGMIVGTGLGLTVVKKCVDRHQGKITIESKVGVGTTVTINLPRKFWAY